ncbi:hypothetical protein X975_10307, partial [Stegodyphus mimosarum]
MPSWCNGPLTWRIFERSWQGHCSFFNCLAFFFLRFLQSFSDDLLSRSSPKVYPGINCTHQRHYSSEERETSDNKICLIYITN